MRVLLSAYACEPDKGSEPEVGLRTMLSAARRHEVWVITRENNLPALSAYLERYPPRGRVHLQGLDVPGPALKWKKRHPLASQIYYDRWQKAAGDLAQRLHRDIGFELAHHVTFAAYWKRTGVARLEVPFVWGPVGGGVAAPWVLWRELGWTGVLEELGRLALRPMIARSLGVAHTKKRAGIVIAQNKETARRLGVQGRILVLPNATSVSVADTDLPEKRDRYIATVGNLIPLKGVGLALRAFAAARTEGIRLLVIGDGPERRGLERLAQSLGVYGRVEFLGRMPRSETLRHIAAASVLLHTSLHEEAGMVVAEALSFGTPVVCLDQGGPPELLRCWPQVPSLAIRPSSREQTVDDLGRSLDRILGGPPPATGLRAPSRSYEEQLLETYEQVASSASL